MRSLLMVLLLVPMIMVAACQQKKEPGPPVLNGKWASTDGVYTATFYNGSFQAVANDTGNVLSKGSYLAMGSDQIQIKWTSELTGNNNQANCVRSSPNSLDCTDLAGSRFGLRRSTG